MNQPTGPDRDAFQRVWRRVMPQDRPDCPFTLDAPPPPGPPAFAPPPERPLPPPRPTPQPPAVCLGEGSREELPQLEEAMTTAAQARKEYRAWAARWRQEPLFRELARAKDSQVKRLAAAYFLIAGRSYSIPDAGLPRIMPLNLVLRDRHRAEQEAALALFQMADRARDPCLVRLYRTLGQEDQGFARRLRARLERGG